MISRPPLAQTAQRPSWPDLPATLRREIAALAGAPVVEATSQGGGFTHGFASRLLLDDGRRVFVKAAPREQGWVAESYEREVEVVRLLPHTVDAARVEWTTEAGDWFAAGFEDIDGHHPTRPWQIGELRRVVDALAANARALTPAPRVLAAPHFSQEFAACASMLAAAPGAHTATCLQLARHLLAEGLATTLMHNDLRDDNMLLTDGGRVVVIDWNHVSVAPAWFDVVSLLVGPHADRLDVDSFVAEHPLTREVPPDHIDGLLALLYGYFRTAAAQPTVDTSPFLRSHQAWYRDAVWSWLSSRRGWLVEEPLVL